LKAEAGLVGPRERARTGELLHGDILQPVRHRPPTPTRSALEAHKIMSHTRLAFRVSRFVVTSYWTFVSIVIGMGTQRQPRIPSSTA
jgi:hypothetical protein